MTERVHDEHIVHAGWLHTAIAALCLCLALTTGLSVYFAFQLNKRLKPETTSTAQTSSVSSEGTSTQNANTTPAAPDLSSSPLYYSGTIGSAPVRLVLNYHDSATQKSYYTGLLVYENTSPYPFQVRGYFANNTQPDCQKYCQFNLTESDLEQQTGRLSGTNDQNLDNLTGTYTKTAGSSQKVSLKRTEAFNYNDYLKK